METEILRITGTGRTKIKDIVADEQPLTIDLDGSELVTLLCSPSDIKELSIGFLYSSGIIRAVGDIGKIVIDGNNSTAYVKLKKKIAGGDMLFKRIYSSGCGRGIIFYNMLDKIPRKKLKKDFYISAVKIMSLMKLFEKKSAVFKKTGGVHSAGFSPGKGIAVFKEDIGRHNALDKIIGEALIKNLDFENMIMLTSGRLSSEIMFKIRRTGVSVIVSRGAPTDQAVKLAREWDLTLAGFVRGGRMNVYSAEERII
ncbi:formate dehydrogenase accessory sulfurtransferase FdhD [bacterium]|nr:formate dehydrogenase accessory sulfurtransferase FdhD [Candidatus Omnitrophota bacterium]MBU2528409.1 formate dehydrogenase accessory sulfurtransferase FdhD [bacterium]MBU3930667.1 formate dehydrogenase accessory sulfurtransferase FdhD [bacterium]MBU4123437.1 formate dehydrogenase accessory sulfurtransferase FdhD [bacterium]